LIIALFLKHPCTPALSVLNAGEGFIPSRYGETLRHQNGEEIKNVRDRSCVMEGIKQKKRDASWLCCPAGMADRVRVKYPFPPTFSDFFTLLVM